MTGWKAWPLALASWLLLATGPAAAVADQGVTLDQRRLAALAELPALRGEALDPADLAGKAVAVTFFASWCPPCRDEFRQLTRAKETFGGRLEVVAVNIFESFGNNRGGERLIPTVYVFGPDGQVAMAFIHARGATKRHVTFEELEAVIRTLP
jgi:thiol-disulfide isomerase/thioredoxin